LLKNQKNIKKSCVYFGSRISSSEIENVKKIVATFPVEPGPKVKIGQIIGLVSTLLMSIILILKYFKQNKMKWQNRHMIWF
jgi:hypothetical protein